MCLLSLSAHISEQAIFEDRKHFVDTKEWIELPWAIVTCWSQSVRKKRIRVDIDTDTSAAYTSGHRHRPQRRNNDCNVLADSFSMIDRLSGNHTTKIITRIQTVQRALCPVLGTVVAMYKKLSTEYSHYNAAAVARRLCCYAMLCICL